MIRSRVAKVDPLAEKEGLVVVVITEQSNVDWCKEHFTWGKREGVQKTICANAQGKRCNGEIVDMFALSLGDFLIVANSTFSWWAHYFRYCRQFLRGWQLISSELETREGQPQRGAARGISIFPFRWYTHDKRMKQSRQKVFDLFTGNIMVPAPKTLFEGYDI
jgi:hypothetical protein